MSHVGGRSGDRFHSPDEQAAAIEGWARARGVRVEMLPPELDESGGRADRPILTAAIEGIERGEYAGLAVAYLSRASRSVRHLLELWERIEGAGGQVVAVAENVDTSTPAGRLTRTMLAAIAEHELDLHRERFEQLRASATTRGIWQRRQTPLGYVRDPATRRLIASPDAERVRRAFAARAAGQSLVSVARDVGLTPSGTRALLRNRVYVGELRVGEHVNRSAHPPLLSEDAWQAAQVTAPRPPRSRAHDGPALLAGLARCASCGHVMTRGSGVYGCVTHHSAGNCPAPTAVSATRIETFVERVALHELAQLTATAAPDDSRLTTARHSLTAAERELGAYLAAVSAADVGPDAFAAGARQRRDAVQVAAGEVMRLLASQPLTLNGDPVAQWPTLSAEHRNRLLRGLIETVLVRPVGRGRRVPIEDRVRIVAGGSGLVDPGPRGGAPHPVAAVAWPDADDPVVLGTELTQD